MRHFLHAELLILSIYIKMVLLKLCDPQSFRKQEQNIWRLQEVFGKIQFISLNVQLRTRSLAHVATSQGTRGSWGDCQAQGPRCLPRGRCSTGTKPFRRR